MTATESLQKGLQFVNDAVEVDKNADFRSAIHFYQLAIDCFKEALFQKGGGFGDIPIETKSILPQKIQEYELRISQLQGFLSNSTENTSSSNFNSNQHGPTSNLYYSTSNNIQNSHLDSSSDQYYPTHPKRDLEFNNSINLIDERSPFDFSNDKEWASNDSSDCDECENRSNSLKVVKRGEGSLEKALELANKAKAKDALKKYSQAFIYYTQALEYFADAAKHAPVGIMVALNRMMKHYMDRAETIKVVLEKYKAVPKVKKPVFPNDETVTEYHLRMVKTSKTDLRIGPLFKKITTSFWNDGRPLFFQAKLPQNIFSPGENIELDVIIDNKTSIKLNSLRVELLQYNTSTTISLNGNKNISTSLTRLNCHHYYEKFPVAMGSYRGTINYLLPVELDPTEADSSACFAREYELAINIDIFLHQNVNLIFPVRIILGSY